MAVRELLRSCPLFFELFDEEIDKIVRKCEVHSYKPGEFIVRDGEEGEDICIFLSGRAIVEKDTGQERIKVMEISPGDVVGEMVLVGEKKRTADIIAEQKCDVLIVPFNSIYSIFKKEPSIFALMMLNLSRILIKKMKGSNQIIVSLQQKLSEARVEAQTEAKEQKKSAA